MKRLLIKLQRIRHSKGFGAQSPFAYSFITEVINQKLPYYHYTELVRIASEKNMPRLNILKFYFRLANYIHPAAVIDYCCSSYSYSKAFSLGCADTQIFTLSQSGQIDSRWFQQTLLVRMSLIGDYTSFFDSVAALVNEDSVLVVEGIHASEETMSFWSRVLDSDYVFVTFDIYDAGIVFFNRNYYKQNYIVNF